MSELARPHTEVTLAAFATVVVGLEDGLPLAELLLRVGLPAEAWAAAREAWEERVVDDLEAGGTLAEELEAAKTRALLGWERGLAPLDRELRAYLDFERALAAADDAEAFLRAHGLRSSDPLRLLGVWAPRLADPEVQREALAILNELPGDVPPVEASPARLGTIPAASDLPRRRRVG
ncbi:MAG: hypothetical protein HY908_24835 [Myxococcales bacterium]|nr:hypothetical protein [Myxococcales bacterium]